MFEGYVRKAKQLLDRLNRLAATSVRLHKQYYRDLGDDTTWEMFIANARAKLTKYSNPNQPDWGI